MKKLRAAHRHRRSQSAATGGAFAECSVGLRPSL